MRPFIERFVDRVLDYLGFPGDTRNLSRVQLLELMDEANAGIFESLLRVALPESTFSYAEATITLQADVWFYRLPPNCRTILGLERRDTNGAVIAKLHTRSHYDGSRECGHVEVLSGVRGFRLHREYAPTSDEEWTLKYLRGPGVLHYAEVEEWKDNFLVGSPPSADAGELVRQDDYYNGLILRVYDADNGAAPQEREVVGYQAGTNTFLLRHAWDRVSASAYYEVCPCLPYPQDSLIAAEAALPLLISRDQQDKARMVQAVRKRMLETAFAWVAENVADRAPARIIRPGPLDNMPMGDREWETV